MLYTSTAPIVATPERPARAQSSQGHNKNASTRALPNLPTTTFSSDSESSLDPYESRTNLRLPPSPPTSRPSSALDDNISPLTLAARAGFERRQGIRSGSSEFTNVASVFSRTKSGGTGSTSDVGMTTKEHLPDVMKVGGLTAYPISLVMKDIEYSVKKLISEKVSFEIIFSYALAGPNSSPLFLFF